MKWNLKVNVIKGEDPVLFSLILAANQIRHVHSRAQGLRVRGNFWGTVAKVKQTLRSNSL